MSGVGSEAYESAGLLDGLDAKGRAERIALLDRLTLDGFSLAELVDAAALDRLVLLPVECALTRDDPKYTSVQVAERSGLSLELLTQLWLAMGFADPGPEVTAFTEADVRAAGSVAGFLAAGIPLEALVRITRVMAHHRTCRSSQRTLLVSRERRVRRR